MVFIILSLAYSLLKQCRDVIMTGVLLKRERGGEWFTDISIFFSAIQNSRRWGSYESDILM